jgi:hypothetical protein
LPLTQAPKLEEPNNTGACHHIPLNQFLEQPLQTNGAGGGEIERQEQEVDWGWNEKIMEKKKRFDSHSRP